MGFWAIIEEEALSLFILLFIAHVCMYPGSSLFTSVTLTMIVRLLCSMQKEIYSVWFISWCFSRLLAHGCRSWSVASASSASVTEVQGSLPNLDRRKMHINRANKQLWVRVYLVQSAASQCYVFQCMFGCIDQCIAWWPDSWLPCTQLWS